jgi:hypothetical protein
MTKQGKRGEATTADSSAVGQREKAKTLVSGRFRVMDEVDYFWMADGPEVL